MELRAKINTRKLVIAFNRFPEQLRSNVGLALKIHGRDIQRLARQKHRFVSQSYKLEASVEVKSEASELKTTIGLETSVAPYGPYIHDGTGKYGKNKKAIPITVKNAPVLAWLKKNGKMAFAKSVLNPGIRPDKFIVKAAKALSPQFPKKINEAISKAARGAFI